MSFLDQLYHKVWIKVFPHHIRELEKAVGNCKTVLDVGCGDDSGLQYFSKRRQTAGVEIFAPAIAISKKKGIHDKYYKMSVMDIGDHFKENSFDCVLACGLIEHLTKKDGLKLIAMMEKIAKKKVIFTMPNGFIHQGPVGGNKWQIHRSGWSATEMRKKGYEVIGFSGYKPLRGEQGIIRFWPRRLWLLVSDMTQPFVRNKPDHAFEILCVKTK